MSDTTTQGSGNRDLRITTPHNQSVVVAATDAQLSPATAVGSGSTRASFDDAVAAFLSAGVDNPGTRRVYARHLKRASEVFGDVAVRDINGEDLARYRLVVLGAPWAPTTQSQALSAVRSCLSWVGALGGHRLPADAIRVALRAPRATVRTKFSVVNEKEIGSMFGAARTSRERALLGLLLGAGLRVAEAAALRVEDVFEDDQGGTVIFVRQGKNRKDRSVPVGPEVDELIRRYLVDGGRHLRQCGPTSARVRSWSARTRQRGAHHAIDKQACGRTGGRRGNHGQASQPARAAALLRDSLLAQRRKCGERWSPSRSRVDRDD